VREIRAALQLLGRRLINAGCSDQTDDGKFEYFVSISLALEHRTRLPSVGADESSGGTGCVSPAVLQLLEIPDPGWTTQRYILPVIAETRSAEGIKFPMQL